MEEAIWDAGLEEVEAYVLMNHNTVVYYIATRPILDLCEEAVWRTGTWGLKNVVVTRGVGLGRGEVGGGTVGGTVHGGRNGVRGVAGN